MLVIIPWLTMAAQLSSCRDGYVLGELWISVCQVDDALLGDLVQGTRLSGGT